MAASGYTPVVLYNSGTTTNAPLAANLANGELAINYADGKLFYKNGSGNVTVLAATAGTTNITTLGTVTTGTWNATTIGVGYGGTGITTTPANGALLIGNGTGYTSATLTAGSNVTITNSSGAITIAATGTSSTYTRTSFTATSGQTTFSVTYTVGYIQVYLNGVLLNASDYTASSGTSVVLATGATTGDIVETIAYNTTSLGTASTANNLAGGSAGVLPYQSASGVTGFSAAGTNGQALLSGGTGSPTWGTLGPVYGGTGVSNGTSNTITFSGNYGLTLTLSGSTSLTLPTSGTLTALGGANTWTGTQTFNGSSSTFAAVLLNAAETTTVSATAATGTINFYVNSQSVLYYTSNASANWTLNVAFSSGTSLNTAMSTGQTVTIAFMVTQGSTAYYENVFQIDGTNVTPKWQGGTAPSKGNASGIDVYTYTITKTGSAAYTVLASQTQFA